MGRGKETLNLIEGWTSSKVIGNRIMWLA